LFLALIIGACAPPAQAPMIRARNKWRARIAGSP
jgi:hypothetical protein